jgi:hypothetical protein
MLLGLVVPREYNIPLLIVGFLLKDPNILEFMDTGLTNTCLGFEYFGDTTPIFGDLPKV